MPSGIQGKIIVRMMLLVLYLLLRYIKYVFLTGSVVCSLVVLLFIIINTNPQFSFSFLQMFSYLNPMYATGTFSMGIEEIMQIFLAISFVFMIIGIGITEVLKKLFKRDLSISAKAKMTLIFILMSIAYAIGAILVLLRDLDPSFYGILAIFFIFNFISATLYFIVDRFSIPIEGLFSWIK
ncbi:MAG: hypothetical protein ABIH34_04785 [Nanoarchaeota archaeon]